ncbi:hypothetical protein HDU76_002873, partial [Blyttiomyces sp. JEL0837]
QNTNLHKPLSSLKSTVKPPRLGGLKSLGVLATRTPHRPSPIGLSLARILSVDPQKGIITLSGADLVNGTPVFDLKPYVRFSDSPLFDYDSVSEDATATAVEVEYHRHFAPNWVTREIEDGMEPLTVGSVVVDDGVEGLIVSCWERVVRTNPGSAASLYKDGTEFVDFVLENLRLDFRSARERNVAGGNNGKGGDGVDGSIKSTRFEKYRVTLCDVVIIYRIVEGDDAGNGLKVVLIGAELVTAATAQPQNEF